MKRLYLVLTLFLGLILFAACAVENNTVEYTPEVTKTPAEGFEGDSLIIEGVDFDDDIYLEINSEKLTMTLQSKTKIGFIVPKLLKENENEKNVTVIVCSTYTIYKKFDLKVRRKQKTAS